MESAEVALVVHDSRDSTAALADGKLWSGNGNEARCSEIVFKWVTLRVSQLYTK
jgi:hypothetical protein